MELTSANVHATFVKCLYKENPSPEEAEKAVRVYGIMNNIGFNPDFLELQRENIDSMIMQLPRKFRLSEFTGIDPNIIPGETFLNGCMTDVGQQWGEHRSVEELMILGIAIGKCKFPLPRKLWYSLPGSVPYYVILDTDNIKSVELLAEFDSELANIMALFEATKVAEA